MKRGIRLSAVLFIGLGSIAYGQTSLQPKRAAFCLGVIEATRSPTEAEAKNPGLTSSDFYTVLRQRIDDVEEIYKRIIQRVAPTERQILEASLRLGIETQKVCDARRTLCLSKCEKSEGGADQTKLCVALCHQFEECRQVNSCFKL